MPTIIIRRPVDRDRLKEVIKEAKRSYPRYGVMPSDRKGLLLSKAIIEYLKQTPGYIRKTKRLKCGKLFQFENDLKFLIEEVAGIKSSMYDWDDDL